MAGVKIPLNPAEQAIERQFNLFPFNERQAYIEHLRTTQNREITPEDKLLFINNATPFQNNIEPGPFTIFKGTGILGFLGEKLFNDPQKIALFEKQQQLLQGFRNLQLGLLQKQAESSFEDQQISRLIQPEFAQNPPGIQQLAVQSGLVFPENIQNLQTPAGPPELIPPTGLQQPSITESTPTRGLPGQPLTSAPPESQPAFPQDQRILAKLQQPNITPTEEGVLVPPAPSNIPTELTDIQRLLIGRATGQFTQAAGQAIGSQIGQPPAGEAPKSLEQTKLDLIQRIADALKNPLPKEEEDQLEIQAQALNLPTRSGNKDVDLQLSIQNVNPHFATPDQIRVAQETVEKQKRLDRELQSAFAERLKTVDDVLKNTGAINQQIVQQKSNNEFIISSLGQFSKKITAAQFKGLLSRFFRPEFVTRLESARLGLISMARAAGAKGDLNEKELAALEALEVNASDTLEVALTKLMESFGFTARTVAGFVKQSTARLKASQIGPEDKTRGDIAKRELRDLVNPLLEIRIATLEAIDNLKETGVLTEAQAQALTKGSSVNADALLDVVDLVK